MSDFLKRCIDVSASVAGLLVLSPLMILIAAFIKLDSPGTVLFRQERVGLRGRPFRIHKFRTMYSHGSAAGLPITAGKDPRITRVGKVIRRYKLDELPQLVDVLTGTMSLVGPRPEVPRYVAYYPESQCRKILSVRPGITDLASIEFIDEASILGASSDPEQAYIKEVLPRKLELALAYVDSRSNILDLRIIGATLARIIGFRRPL